MGRRSRHLKMKYLKGKECTIIKEVGGNGCLFWLEDGQEAPALAGDPNNQAGCPQGFTLLGRPFDNSLEPFARKSSLQQLI